MPLQLRAFAPVSGWRPPALSALPTWRGAYRVSIDTETRDPQLLDLGPGFRRGAYVVGVSFAVQRTPDEDLERVPAYYLPIRHEGGGNMDRAAVLEWLATQAAGFAGDLVGAKMDYDLDGLASSGVTFGHARCRDVQVLEPLLDELQYSYSLQSIAERNGLQGKDEALLDQAARHFCGMEPRRGKKWNPKAHIWRLPSHHVGPYAEVDARRPLEILRGQERRIRATDSADERVQSGSAKSLWSLWELECELLPILVAMRRRGVRVDLPHLDVVEARCVREEHAATAAFSTAVARRLEPSDLNKEAIVGPLIESVVGRMGRTKTGKVELQNKKLKALNHPTVNLYLRARKFARLRTNNIAGIREAAIGDRVHCTFNQVKRTTEEGSDDEGTITGRLSVVDPPLQQQPVRDQDIGDLWRKAYLADEGAEWICCDYSAQEPRWLIHFAAESKLSGAAEMRETFRANPDTKLYEVLRDRIGWKGDEGKERAKTIYLGNAYGMGGAKAARGLGLPTKWIEMRNGRWLEVAGDEAQRILDDFFRGVPFIPELNEKAAAVARKKGFVRTVLGRRLHFPRRMDGGPGYDFLHKAVNKIVQGSSADQTKKAMVDAAKAGIPLQLQVHDELDLSGDRKTGKLLAEIMLAAVPCTVPHRVKPEAGPSWGELEVIE